MTTENILELHISQARFCYETDAEVNCNACQLIVARIHHFHCQSVGTLQVMEQNKCVIRW